MSTLKHYNPETDKWESVSGGSGAIPEALPNPNALTIHGTSYDGSVAVDMTEAIESLLDTKLQPETVTVLSDNLFDKSSAVAGQGWYHSSSGVQLVTAPDVYAAHVELRGAGIYRTKVCIAHHGESYAMRVPLMNTDKVWIQNITGIVTDTGDNNSWDLEFTVTQEMIDAGAAYYTMTVHKNYIDSLMMVKDRDYPNEFIPYGYIEQESGTGTKAFQLNKLYGKTALFLGDSICAGDLEGSAYDGYGWAGLIGEKNHMTWKNYGRNGGTITPVDSVDTERWVSTQAELALADYPQTDYLIFEGGTNDADILTASGLGIFSESGYSPAEDIDFTSAFERLIFRILEAYPTAKIGYIIPQKMGAVDDHSTANTRRAFFDRAAAICEKWGIPCLDLWKTNPLNPTLSTASRFYTDGQHLTLEGYRKITPQIEAFMRNL